MSDKYDLVIYHGGCYDGFTSAWLVWAANRYRAGAEFHPAVYNEVQRPDCRDKNVLMVDFSYDRETLLQLHKDAESLLVLDHHKTAEVALKGLDFCEFDMERSGCQMVWDHLHPQRAGDYPWLVEHVADRDLWRLELPQTPAIHAYYTSVKMQFEDWHEMHLMGRDNAVKMGKAIRQSIDRYCEKCGKQAYASQLPGIDHKVIAVNVPYLNASEMAHYLLEIHGSAEISVGWFKRGDGRYQYSLRSRQDGPDVGSIAKLFGGGGHEHAAGFDQAMEILL